jgi:hypothetical protein
MHRLQKHCLAAGVALLPLLFPIATKAATFSQVYVFGDSLSDTGNVYRRTLRLYPRPPYFKGRFSNGLLWNEYVTQGLGVELDRNDNYAYGGTTTGEEDAVSFPLLEFPGLQKQVRSFVETILLPIPMLYISSGQAQTTTWGAMLPTPPFRLITYLLRSQPLPRQVRERLWWAICLTWDACPLLAKRRSLAD